MSRSTVSALSLSLSLSALQAHRDREVAMALHPPKITFPLFIVCLVLLLYGPPTSGDDALHQICDTTSNYTAGSTYLSNLNLLLTSLPSNGSLSGFSKSTVGRIPNQVDGLVLCRGDTNTTGCRACLDTAIQDVLNLCPYNKGAVIWYDRCLLRYSNQRFLSSDDKSLLVYLWNDRAASAARWFIVQVVELMETISQRAAYNSSRRFATGEMNISGDFQILYGLGLVQCTPDLSEVQCSRCLKGFVDVIPKDLGGKVGGKALAVKCNLRYGVYKFYDGTPTLMYASPPAGNGTASVPPGVFPSRERDPIKCEQLYWGRRYKIIEGIAQGLLYLHENSRLKIIHRDLKASNILLDANMNPKISDFGLARLSGEDQNQGTTNRVVGTVGYMAPEYAMFGKFSSKSDVFSFGVLVLETVTGRKNSSFFDPDNAKGLLSYTWEHWSKGTIWEILDPSLGKHCHISEVLRCIQIGLLCVQRDPVDRPDTSTVVVMLNSNSVALQAPSRPAFCIGKNDMDQSLSKKSQNELSISQMEPR